MQNESMGSDSVVGEIVLRHRRKPIGRSVWKIAGGLAAILGGVSLLALGAVIDLGYARLLGVALGAAGFIGGSVVLVDGATDVIVWRRVHRGPEPVMRLTGQGVEYSKAFSGTYDLSVPWDEVVGSAFRPGFGGGPVFCLDVDSSIFPPPPAEYGCDPGADPVTMTARALIWAKLVAPRATSVQQAMLVDVYMFGTPLVMNLALCLGLDPADLDRALDGWTDGRCRCDPMRVEE